MNTKHTETRHKQQTTHASKANGKTTKWFGKTAIIEDFMFVHDPLLVYFCLSTYLVNCLFLASEPVV